MAEVVKGAGRGWRSSERWHSHDGGKTWHRGHSHFTDTFDYDTKTYRHDLDGIIVEEYHPEIHGPTPR